MRVAAGLGAAALLALAPAGCATSSLIMQNRTDEYRNPEISVESVRTVAIVPSDPHTHDRQIAARSWEIAQAEKFPAIYRGVSTSDHAAAMRSVCEATGEDAVDAVAFVTFGRIVLHECESKAVAWEITGPHAGVDLLTRRMVAYLRNDLVTD